MARSNVTRLYGLTCVVLLAFAPAEAPAGLITEIIDDTGDGSNSLGCVESIVLDGSANIYVGGGWSDNAFKITRGGVIATPFGFGYSFGIESKDSALLVQPAFEMLVGPKDGRRAA